ncbi:MAG: hypothetical protein O2971_19365 [Proteobacteria bacterium]|nr:hypothetical protein [Pseudomonadota bacterium]
MRNFFRNHPTMVITLGYFIVTGIGVVYSIFFYREFGSNIVKFADVTDFLLASIVEPISIVIFLGILVFTLTMFQLDFWVRRKWPGYKRWLERRFAPKYTDPLIISLIVIIFVPYSVRQFAIDNGKVGDTDNFIT